MEILKEFDFDYREPRSQWAPFIAKLINGEDGRAVHAIKLVQGRDFSDTTGVENAHTGLATFARKQGRRVRTRKFPDAKPPYIVVGLRPEGEGPRAPRRRRREATAA